MIEQEKETENPNEIVDIVEKIRQFDKQQQGQGPKILSPSQMLSRFQISLAQLKAVNNSENLKMKSDNYCIFVQIKKTYKITLYKFG